MPTLTKLSTEDLYAENERLMGARGEAEQGFKTQQRAVNDELDRRAATAKLEVALEGLSPEARAQVLADLAGSEG